MREGEREGERERESHTFLLEREVLGEMSTLMVASEHEERVGIEHLERPQIQHALHTDRSHTDASYQHIQTDHTHTQTHHTSTDHQHRPHTHTQTHHTSTDHTQTLTHALTLDTRWSRGAVVSVVRHMNEVTLRRARLVLGWVTVFGRIYHYGT